MSPTTTTTAAVPLSALHDPTSAAYKKARRQHLKTTRNRPEHVDADWTPFRAAEKKYKARFPPPDLSGVLDLAAADERRRAETERGGWRGCGHAVPWRELELKTGESSRGRRAFTLPSAPGLVLLPSFVPPEEQRSLVRWSLSEQARHPNETNLDAHYNLPKEGLWTKYVRMRQTAVEDEYIEPRALPPSTSPTESPSGPRKLISNESASKDNYATLVATPKPPPTPSTSAQPMQPAELVPKLRWANIGWSYHWGTKQYDFTKGRGTISEHIRNVCTEAVGTVPWGNVYADDQLDGGDWGDEAAEWQTWSETYEPDAGIVNFYQSKDTLMGHVDRSEVCATSPLVSISLGCAAIFLIGGLTRDVEPVPILLRSGDVVIMSGPACRRAYHGVPRILEDTLPLHFEGGNTDDDWELYEEYLRTTRININVRQVFPQGFNPSIGLSPGESN